ncbi:hypothetical protein BKH12_03330 [Actinomyces naeslundii]|nr:hypothetical protein BKH12_03330 [Actinomyces naeslundii]
MTRAQAGGPGGWPTLMCQVLTPRTRDQGAADLIVMSWDDPDPAYPGSGVPAAAVLAGSDPGQGPPVTGAQLASYAALAPVTRRSGSSIRGEHVSHAGNKRLKRAMFPSLRLTALRPRQPGLLPAQTQPRQNALGQAVLTQAHHRILTLHATIHNDTLHNRQQTETTHRRSTHHIRAPVARCA